MLLDPLSQLALLLLANYANYDYPVNGVSNLILNAVSRHLRDDFCMTVVNVDFLKRRNEERI